MMNTKLVWVVALLCSALVLAGKTVESASDISFQTTPENVTIQAGKAATFQCLLKVKQKNSTIVFSFLTKGIGGNITCPWGHNVDLDGRAQAECHLDVEDQLRATWTINKATKEDDGAQLSCGAPGRQRITSFLTVTSSTANIDEPTPIIGLVLGGFLGCLLLFALIGCGLICYARCKRQQEDDKADIVHSFSNPSWIGSTDDTSEKTSKFTTENDYVDPVKLASKETTLKSLPDRDDLGGLF